MMWQTMIWTWNGEWEGEDIADREDTHMMSTLMDVLQCCGVGIGEATEYCVNAIKKPSGDFYTIWCPVQSYGI